MRTRYHGKVKAENQDAPVGGAPVGGTPSEEQFPTRNEVLQKKGTLWAGTGLTDGQKLFLATLSVVGMPYRATREARDRYGVVCSLGGLRKWREDPVFSDLYETIRREYWDRFAHAGVALATGGKMTGGSANLLMQQLNRAIPDEYLPPIVQQIHQNVTYQADGEFKVPEPVEKASVKKAAEAPKDMPVN